MDKPDFSSMSVAELEEYIQGRDREVVAIRADMFDAHQVLEAKEGQERAIMLAKRPANFPPEQGIGKAN